MTTERKETPAPSMRSTLGMDLAFAIAVVLLDALAMTGLVMIGQLFVQSYSLLIPIVLPGAAQFLYKLPLMIFCAATKKKQAFRVLCYSAALVVLLNGGCFGLIFIGSALG